MIIFDGITFAAQKEHVLKEQAQALHQRGIFPKIAAILFTEDSGSQLYTQLKQQAASRVGIGYEVHRFSMIDQLESVLSKIMTLNADQTITGIIIQKPSRKRWETVTNGTHEQFVQWWQQLVQALDEKKDVDGLHPHTLAAVEQGTWQQEGKVLPATAAAVLSILGDVTGKKIIIVGRSDILGKPLYFALRHQPCVVEMIGTTQLKERMANGQKLLDADVVVSATGQQHVITGDMLKDGVWVVDVGEPKPDIDRTSVAAKAAFLTPVPGGVGPVTIMCLLENCLTLASK